MSPRLLAGITVVLWCLLLSVPASQAKPDVWPEEIRFGLIPSGGSEQTLERFEVLFRHLEKMLAVSVKGVTAKNYSGIISAMNNCEIDFAYFGPFSYVEAAESGRIQVLALELDESGRRGYHGLILARSGSGILSMEQGRGKRFAFTDPKSTSGFLVPSVFFFRDLLVKPDDFFRSIAFSGSHRASILGLQQGKYDLVATNDIDLSRVVERGEVKKSSVVTLWRSELIPGSPVCARKNLPDSLKAAFTGALLMFNANPEGLSTLRNGGFAPATDATYDFIRYMRKLKQELGQ